MIKSENNLDFGRNIFPQKEKLDNNFQGKTKFPVQIDPWDESTEASPEFLVSGDTEGDCIVWNISNQQKLTSLKVTDESISVVKRLTNGHYALGTQTKLLIIEVKASDKSIKLIHTVDNVHSDYIFDICFANSNEILTCGDDKTIKLFTEETALLGLKKLTRQKIILCKSKVCSLCLVSEDLLACGCKDKTIKMFDFNLDQFKSAAMTGHTNYINSIIMMESDLISAAAAGEVIVWDSETYARKNVLDVKPSVFEYSNVLCNIDNKKLAVAANDKTIAVFNFTTYQKLRILGNMHFNVRDLVWLGGDILASTGGFNILFWNLETGTRTYANCQKHTYAIA